MNAQMTPECAPTVPRSNATQTTIVSLPRAMDHRLQRLSAAILWNNRVNLAIPFALKEQHVVQTEHGLAASEMRDRFRVEGKSLPLDLGKLANWTVKYVQEGSLMAVILVDAIEIRHSRCAQKKLVVPESLNQKVAIKILKSVPKMSLHAQTVPLLAGTQTITVSSFHAPRISVATRKNVLGWVVVQSVLMAPFVAKIAVSGLVALVMAVLAVTLHAVPKRSTATRANVDTTTGATIANAFQTVRSPALRNTVFGKVFHFV